MSLCSESAYKEILESSETYNTRLCIERRLRMPFLDPQTGTAQNHSQLHKSKRQRMPGLREGQLYSYPSARWRKARRQYLTRGYYRPREPDSLLDGDFSNHGGGGDSMPAHGLDGMETKDSHHSGIHVKDDVSNNPWYYDELDAMEMDEYDDAGQDSDLDFEESYSKKKGGKKGRGEGRKSKAMTGDRTGSDTPTKKSTGSRRGRKSKLNMDGDRSSSPMTYSTKKSRHSTMQLHDDHSNSSFVANLDNPATPHMPPHPQQQQHQMIAPRPELFGNTMAEQQTPLIPVSVSNASSASSSSSGMPPGVGGPLADAGPVGPPAPSATAATPSGGGGGGVSEKDHSRRGEKGKLAAPSPYCDFCLGDTRENKKTGTAEELVSCSDCGRSGHPSCLQFTANMMISVKRYRWQCIECKYCSICGTSDNDDQLLFCDDCDRGYHMYCLSPALTAPPEGSWSCKLCVVEFHTPKGKGGGAPVAAGGPPGASQGMPPGPPPPGMQQQGPPPPGMGPGVAGMHHGGGYPPHPPPPGMPPHQMMGHHGPPPHPSSHHGPMPPQHPVGPPPPMMHHPPGGAMGGVPPHPLSSQGPPPPPPSMAPMPPTTTHGPGGVPPPGHQ